MAEHVGQALWNLYGLVHALKVCPRSAAEANKLHEALNELNMLSAFIKVRPPEPHELAGLMPQLQPAPPPQPQRPLPTVAQCFNPPPRSGFAASVPVPQHDDRAVGRGSNKKRATPDEMREAESIIADILADHDHMPDPSADWAMGMCEKARSVRSGMEQYKNITEPQLFMLRSMREKQLSAISNAY